jgi:hypothetical protein
MSKGVTGNQSVTGEFQNDVRRRSAGQGGRSIRRRWSTNTVAAWRREPDRPLKWELKDDGGRSRSGIARGGAKDEVGDCVARAIAIATERPYREVHDALTAATVRHVPTAKEGWGKVARRCTSLPGAGDRHPQDRSGLGRWGWNGATG